MELDAFVSELADAAPPASDLEKCGFSNVQARDFIESFRCVRREGPARVVNDSDQLVELLRKWDLAKVEIGMMQFRELPIEKLGTICVGCVESDPLVILPNTGEIAVHELGTKEHLLWLVATNGSKLLDAMIIAARFLAKRTVGTIDFDDYKTARSVAFECAVAAGGDKYLDFYNMLLGAE